MSQQLISRSADLAQLRTEGYDLDVVSGVLLVRDVPYVGPGGTVVRGTLVKALTLSGDVADYQGDHAIFLAGPAPHDHDGNPLTNLINSSARTEPAPGVVVDHLLSNKPAQGYTDYHDLVSTYVTLLCTDAQVLDPNVTAQTYPAIPADEDDDSPFLYIDTHSARAGIAAINAKVKGQRIAIVGLGGTGAFILDLLAKTWVSEVHLYDGDVLMQHNAFRYPGAIPIDVIATKPKKVDHFAAQYAHFRRGVVPHPYRVDETNVEELTAMDFVFVAADDNPSRALIARRLEVAGVAFIDSGMGLYVSGNAIGGQIATTTSLPGKREHLWDDRKRLPINVGAEDVYDQNVQVVDLNALAATLVVGRWKRHVGLYVDQQREHYSSYAVDTNDVANEDH